jgi:hypothetical protein
MIAVTQITKQHLSSITTRDLAEEDFIYDKFPQAYCSKKEMLFDVSPMWERPVVANTTTWSTSDARFKQLLRYNLMWDFFSATPSFRSFLKNYAYFRCHACAYVTITGTLNHQGTLLAAVVPQGISNTTANLENLINTFMTSPHALLGANEATSSCIEIPFYVPTDYLTMEATTATDPSIADLGLLSRNPYAQLMIMVLNPLSVGGNGSTTISIHTQIKITKLEVYTQTPAAPTYVAAPTLLAESYIGRVVTDTFDRTSEFLKTTSSDFIDALRSTVRQYTGLHNPNNPALGAPSYMQLRNRANLVDAPTYFEKLDPYSKFCRMTKDSIFHTNVDEMDMDYILSKPQYLGTFQVSTSDTLGKLLWISPISPWQGGMRKGQCLSSNIERLYYATQAWSGDMELVIQSTMTNKQNLKLLVSRIYGLDRTILTSVPDYNSSLTGITSLLEFSAGNQQLVVDLDFLSRNQVLYNTIDPNANALQHGMYYIYVAQPLLVGDSTPTTVEFNVFLRCKKGFKYYGYGYKPGYSTVANAAGLPFIPFPTILEAESFQESSAPVMNSPSDGDKLTQRDISRSSPLQQVERMYPVENIRDLTRRLQFTRTYLATADTTNVFQIAIPIADLVSLFPRGITNEPNNQALLKMYYAFNMGIRIKIRSIDTSNYFVQYYPPTLVSGSSATPTSTTSLVTSNLSSTSSPYLQGITGPLSGAPFMEMPTTWNADIATGVSAAVMDIHIPHTTMYHWWGASQWTGTTVQTFEGTQEILNNNGFLVISGRAPSAVSSTFDIFVGLDDESRLGYHTVAPVLWLPLNPSKTSYALPERIGNGASSSSSINLNQSTSLYYTNLSTAYNTPL